MRICYFDCFAGAAGDMIAAAMVDSGLDLEFLQGRLATLKLDKLKVEVSEVHRGGLRARRFVPSGGGGHEHHHRNIDDIKAIIRAGEIGERARETAIAIFDRLADAEAAVHGTDREQVHFHEVGAIDSIVDIVSAAIGFDALGIEKVYCSPLRLGGGTVKAAHGVLPVPAPATAELVRGVPVAGGPIDTELLTPTGAAILTTVADGFGLVPEMKIESIGYGAGTLEAEGFANVLRLIIGLAEDETEANTDTVYLLETNIDDVSGELVGATADKLLGNGALDVFTSAISMKHSRPAVKLSVMCRMDDVQKMEQSIFEAGLTFGIRRQSLQRSKLVRDFVTVTTEFGDIRIKTGQLSGRVVNAKPEFADCVRAAGEHNAAVKAVSESAMKAYRELRL